VATVQPEGQQEGAEKQAAGEEKPAQAEEEQQEAAPSIPAPKKVQHADVAIMKQGEREFDDGQVEARGQLAYQPKGALKIKASGIISNAEMDAAGKLDGSFEEKTFLSTTDTAYVKFKSPDSAKMGAKYAIFRPGEDIKHPTTGETMGKRVKVVGEAKVVAVGAEQSTVLITSANEEIERGDLVGSWTSNDVQRVAYKVNDKSVDCTVLAAENNDLSSVGQNNQVFIDKGSTDGVQVGNTFVVRRRGDGAVEKYSKDLATINGDTPDENIGVLLVVDVKDKVSTALVVKSIREIVPGEHAEMRPPGGSGGF
jgi:hypothetical protein